MVFVDFVNSYGLQKYRCGRLGKAVFKKLVFRHVDHDIGCFDTGHLSDGIGQLALKSTGVVDPLLQVTQSKRRTIKDFQTDLLTAVGKALACKEDSRFMHLGTRHENGMPIGAYFVGNGLTLQSVSESINVLQGKIAIK